MPTQKEAWKTYKNVFDEHSIRLLEKLRSQGHFDELQSPIALGKEANVFTASKGDGLIIVKIYRLENCNFNKMYSYLAPDPRFHNIQRKKRLIVFTWVQREYRNLLKAREVMRVPMPIAVKDNIILMEFIGHEQPAPKLKDSEPADPEAFFKKTMNSLRLLYKEGLVHADLSDFNILNLDDEPVFIDFSQCTTIEHPQADEFLRRDLKNMASYFRKQGLKHTEEEIYEMVTKK
jgi:RIO kinase 1